MLKNLIALALSGAAFHVVAAQNYYVVTPLTAETVAKGSISLSPSDLQFGGVTVGTHSAQLVEIRNTGNKPQALNDISITQNSDEFSVSHSCPASLSAGASCSATVVYAPQLTTHVGTLTVKSSPAGNKVLTLQGSRLLTPAKLAGGNEQDFGNVFVGDTATRTWTLKNSGHEAAPLAYGALPVDMLKSGTCGATLAGGASCTVILTWTPTAAGSLDSTAYTVGDQNLAVSGIAVTNLSGGSTQAFGDVFVGDNLSKTWTLSNAAQASTALSYGTLPEGVVKSGTCGASLAGGTSCTVILTWTPTAAGSLASTYTIGGQNLVFSGTAVAKTYTGTASSTSLNFGSLAVGSGTSQVVTLTNTGNQALTLPTDVGSGISTPYSISDACGTTLAVGASCSVTVAYNPTTAGTFNQAASLNMGAAGLATVSLNGSAYASLSMLNVQSYHRAEDYSDENGWYSDAATEIRASASAGTITGVRVLSGWPSVSQGTYHLQWFLSGGQQLYIYMGSDYNCMSYQTGTMTFEVTGTAGTTQFSVPYWVGCDAGSGHAYGSSLSGFTYMGSLK